MKFVVLLLLTAFEVLDWEEGELAEFNVLFLYFVDNNPPKEGTCFQEGQMKKAKKHISFFRA